MPGLLDFYTGPTDLPEPFQWSPDWAALQRYLAADTGATAWPMSGSGATPENQHAFAWSALRPEQSQGESPARLSGFFEKSKNVADRHRALPPSPGWDSGHPVRDGQSSALSSQVPLRNASFVEGSDAWLRGLRNYFGNSAEALARAPRGLTEMAQDLVTNPGLFLNRAGPGLAGLGMSSPFARGTAASASRARAGLGDLTIDEVNQIQAAVDRAGRPLEVVGSAARGARSAGSDIDYIVPPGHLPYFQGLENKLPGLNPRHGIVPGVGNPNIGPVIRFEPRR